MRAPSLITIDRFAMQILEGRGFNESWTVHSKDDDAYRVRLRHRCGAWAIREVAWKNLASTDQAIEAIAAEIEEIGCYCVPREDEAVPGVE